MAQHRMWVNEMKVRKGSSLKEIWRTGCVVIFTKDFGDRAKNVRELDVLDEVFNPLGPFKARGKEFPTFCEALRHATSAEDGNIIEIRIKNGTTVIAEVDLT